MPSILDANFNQRFHLNRYTNILYKGEVGSVTVQTNPFESARIQVELDSAQTGTLTLTGTCSEGACSEALSFSNIAGKISDTYFLTLTSTTNSGLSGIMTIEALVGQGSPVKNLLFDTSFRGVMFPIDEGMRLENPGYDESWKAVLFCDADNNIELKDRITCEDDPDSGEYEVVERTTRPVAGINDHYKVMLR